MDNGFKRNGYFLIWKNIKTCFRDTRKAAKVSTTKRTEQDHFWSCGPLLSWWRFTKTREQQMLNGLHSQTLTDKWTTHSPSLATTALNTDWQTNLVNVSDVDVDVGGAEQSNPQQGVEGPQRAWRRTITSSWTGRRLRSPTTETQAKIILYLATAHLYELPIGCDTHVSDADWLLYLYEGVTKPEAGSWE